MNNLDKDNTILLIKVCKENCKKSSENLYVKFKSDIDKYHKSRWQKDIEDSCQEFFLRIQEGKVHYEGKGNPDSFIRNTLKNIHLEQYNNNKLKLQSLNELENDGLLPIDENACNPLQNLEKNEQNQIIFKAISELPPKSQQAIMLVYFYGHKPKKAAELIKCDFKIFRKRLDYGEKQLRKKLKNYFHM